MVVAPHGTPPGRLPLALRYPVTLALLAALAAVAVATGSAWHALPAAVIREVGFQPTDVADLELGRLLSSLWFTAGPWSLAQALFMTGVFVGLLERRAGSGWAAVAFVGLHVLSFATLALLYALPPTHDLVRNARDVGASAGYFGVLAVVLAMRPRWRWLVGALLVVNVVLWLDSTSAHHVLGREVNAGAEHLGTLLYGGAAGWLAAERARRRPDEVSG